MDTAPERSRRVVVLGRDGAVELEPLARRTAEEDAELVVLSLGHPLSPGQAQAVADVLRMAEQVRLWLDVVLLTAPEQAVPLVRPRDEVIVLASGRERRMIERAMGRAVMSHPVKRAAANGGSRRHRRLAIRRGGLGTVHRPERAATPRALVAAPGVWADAAMAEDRAVEDASTTAAPMASASESESIEALAGREIVQAVKDTVWTREHAEARKRAALRVYLGAAPGVGKTYAMLSEGQRRRSRGTDVVVAVVQTYGRPRTIEILQGLEVIPPRTIQYRGATFEEMDAEAVIERRPEVALVDELAHTNIPGSDRAKRWEDVLDILAEGITVITTLNVQHLASVNDVVTAVTGVRQQETVPDWILDMADDIELVDISPHALQRRMIHGNVYPDPRKAELALRRFFTTENLTALRELALMRVANRVDETLLTRWSKGPAPETRERILVCVSRPRVAEDLVRRGARIAQRTGGDLLVVHVATEEREPDPEWVERVEHLVDELGGEFQILPAEDAVEAVLSFAYQQAVTQILVGESLRSRWQEMLGGSFVNRLIQRASNVDVHVMARRDRKGGT